MLLWETRHTDCQTSRLILYDTSTVLRTVCKSTMDFFASAFDTLFTSALLKVCKGSIPSGSFACLSRWHVTHLILQELVNHPSILRHTTWRASKLRSLRSGFLRLLGFGIALPVPMSRWTLKNPLCCRIPSTSCGNFGPWCADRPQSKESGTTPCHFIGLRVVHFL